MNVGWAIAALIFVVAIGAVADFYERRATRHADELEHADEHRRLMEEIERHDP